MKTQINEILIIEQDDRRIKLYPKNIVDDVEKFREEVKKINNSNL